MAWGAIVGAAMVAIAFAFGLSAMLAPMRFERAPRAVLLVPLAAMLWLTVLAIDGELSRVDGVLLLGGYAGSVLWMWRLSRRGLAIQATGEIGHTLTKQVRAQRWQAVAVFVTALAGVVAGGEMVIRGADPILGRMGLSETAFGMTVLAFLVSIEELARELPPALKGRPDISYGKVLGSILAMFLFNAGAFALVRPLVVPSEVLRFHSPYCIASVFVIPAFMTRRRIPRWAGALFVAL